MLAYDNADELLKGALYLDLKLHHVLFNQKGKYKIKLKISSSRGDLRQVKLNLNGFKESIFEYEYTSELCYQDSLDIPCQFDDTLFQFEMPKGKLRLVPIFLQRSGHARLCASDRCVK